MTNSQEFEQPTCRRKLHWHAPEGVLNKRLTTLEIGANTPPYPLQSFPAPTSCWTVPGNKKVLPDRLSKLGPNAERDEAAFRTLVEAGHSPAWRRALNVLFVNGAVLELDHDIPVPVLIGMAGNDGGVSEFLELLKSRATSDLARIAGSFLERVIPPIVTVVQETGGRGDLSEEAFGAVFAARFVGQRDKVQSLLYGHLAGAIQGAVAVSDGIGAFALEALREKLRGILTNVLKPEEYPGMLLALQKLQLIEPRLQTSLCGGCGNYCLTISSNPQLLGRCPKCGLEWLTLTLYVFHSSITRFKTQNQDLPLFISAYLRSKVAREMPIGSPKIYPLAHLGNRESTTVEVDVVVPDLRLGIECKEFEDANAPMTRPRVGKLTDELVAQIQGYLAVGIKKILIVTNLNPRAGIKLSQALTKKLPELAGRDSGLEVVPGTPDALLACLDKIAGELAGGLAASFTKKFNSGPTKALPPSRALPVPPVERARKPTDSSNSRLP